MRATVGSNQEIKFVFTVGVNILSPSTPLLFKIIKKLHQILLIIIMGIFKRFWRRGLWWSVRFMWKRMFLMCFWCLRFLWVRMIRFWKVRFSWWKELLRRRKRLSLKICMILVRIMGLKGLRIGNLLFRVLMLLI